MGKVLIRATQGYPQGEGNIPKVSIRLDNTTATKSWMQMQQLQQIAHACAKEMRILGWAERVAFINELPVHTAYCPGELNSFGDLVSRTAAMMAEAANARKAAASKSKSKSEFTKGSAVGTGPTHRPTVWTVGINHQEEIACHQVLNTNILSLAYRIPRKIPRVIEILPTISGHNEIKYLPRLQ